MDGLIKVERGERMLNRKLITVIIIGLGIIILAGVLYYGIIVERHEMPEISQWRNPTEIYEMKNWFEELEWEWTRMEGGISFPKQEIEYVLGDEETIDGVQTTEVFFNVGNEEYQLWVDVNGIPVQAAIDGDPVPQFTGGGFFENMVQMAFYPFMQLGGLNLQEVIEDEKYKELDWEITSSEEKTFGDVEAEVTYVEMNLETPVVSPRAEGEIEFAIGDFGEFQMILEYSWLRSGSEADSGYSMEVLQANPL